jgi:zinc/manganese transport system permease protein
VPVRALAMAFLLILAISVAVTVQIVGTLLVFALLVAPGAAALQVTARPVAGVAISVAVAVAVTWAGLALAYFTDLPVGFLVTTLALGAYAAARTARVLVPA